MENKTIKTPVQSSNAWIAAAMAVLGLWQGFDIQEVQAGILSALGIVPIFKSVQNALKRKNFKPKAYILEGNFFNYAFAALAVWVPSLNPDLFEPVEQLVKQLIGMNWQGAVIALSSIITIILKSGAIKKVTGKDTGIDDTAEPTPPAEPTPADN